MTDDRKYKAEGLASNGFGSMRPIQQPERKFLRQMFFVVGFFMLFNGYLFGLRYSDFATLTFVVLSLIYVVRQRFILFSVCITFVILAAIINFSIIGFVGMSGSDRVWILRCHIAIIFGSILYFATPRQTLLFTSGVFFGGLLGFLVSIAEYMGSGFELVSLGLRSPTAAIRGLGSLDALGGAVRVTGMWGDANELGPVNSLMFIAALFIIKKRKYSKLAVYFAIFSVTSNALYLSFNRSSVIASIASAIRYFLIADPRRIVGVVIRLIASCVIALLVVRFAAPEQIELIAARFDLNAADGNFADRLTSLRGALTLLLEYPGGLSSEVWPDYLRSISSIANPHNAFISTGFGGGLVFAIFSAVSILYCSFKKNTLTGILSAHIFVLFLFEILNFSPGVVYFLGIIWAAPILDFITLKRGINGGEILQGSKAAKKFSGNRSQ